MNRLQKELLTNYFIDYLRNGFEIKSGEPIIDNNQSKDKDNNLSTRQLSFTLTNVPFLLVSPDTNLEYLIINIADKFIQDIKADGDIKAIKVKVEETSSSSDNDKQDIEYIEDTYINTNEPDQLTFTIEYQYNPLESKPLDYNSNPWQKENEGFILKQFDVNQDEIITGSM